MKQKQYHYYGKNVVVQIAADAATVTRGAVWMDEPGNPGDGLRYTGGPRYPHERSITLVWKVSSKSRSAGREAAAYYTGAALWWAQYVNQSADELTGLLLSCAELGGADQRAKVRNNYAQGVRHAQEVFAARVRTLRAQRRYRVGQRPTAEYPDGSRWVVRFDGEQVADAGELADAWRQAYLHEAARTDAEAAAAAEAAAGATGEETTTGDAGSGAARERSPA